MLRVLPVQELKEEHVAGDALGLQAQVLHLQLGHLGVDKNGKLAQPAGPGEARSAALLASSSRKLNCAGHHLPGSQQSPQEELGTPFLPDHWQVEGETSL